MAPRSSKSARASSQIAVSPDETKSGEHMRWVIIPFFVAAAVGVWGIVATIVTLVFRGGLSLKVFGLAVRDKRGRMASRMRCVWRTTIAWVPLCFLYGLAAAIGINTKMLALPVTIVIATAVVHAAAIAYSLWRPSRGLHDRLARTWLVPR